MLHSLKYSSLVTLIVNVSTTPSAIAIAMFSRAVQYLPRILLQDANFPASQAADEALQEQFIALKHVILDRGAIKYSSPIFFRNVTIKMVKNFTQVHCFR